MKKFFVILALLSCVAVYATTTQIKDPAHDYQMTVNADGSINTNTSISLGGSVGVFIAGQNAVAQVQHNYAAINVTAAIWQQLIGSTTKNVNSIDVFDSSGQTLALGVGAPGTEVTQFIIYPGGNGRVTLAIPANSRISVISLSGTVSTGELDASFFQ